MANIDWNLSGRTNNTDYDLIRLRQSQEDAILSDIGSTNPALVRQTYTARTFTPPADTAQVRAALNSLETTLNGILGSNVTTYLLNNTTDAAELRPGVSPPELEVSRALFAYGYLRALLDINDVYADR
ncbi:MAG: hypothetical protein LBD99_03730, partial [Candidatus Margulisbacteria bacterium]|nr:hypothetical protein [Candidatus Margulisiibacteriota bacterium]